MEKSKNRKKRKFEAIRPKTFVRRLQNQYEVPEFEGSLTSLDLILQESSSYQNNPYFNENWSNINSSSAFELDKAVAYALLLTPFTKQNMINFILSDVILPMCFLLLRPHQRYRMAMGIKTKAGTDTGGVFVNEQQSNMMEQDNAADKKRLSHYSYESKAIITNPTRVYIAHDIFCFDILGGAGSQFYKLDDINEYEIAQHHYPREKSIFVVAIPYEERIFPNPLDASGRFSHYTIQGFTDSKSMNALHYSTAALNNAIWAWRETSDRGSQHVETLYHPNADGQYTSNYQPKNTAMWRGPFICYDSRVGKLIPRAGTGHFKSFAGPGFRDLRKGGLMPWITPALFTMTNTS